MQFKHTQNLTYFLYSWSNVKKDKKQYISYEHQLLTPHTSKVRVRRNKIIIMFNVLCKRRNNMLNEPTLDQENTYFNLHHA
jgi:hypothetical protein